MTTLPPSQSNLKHFDSLRLATQKISDKEGCTQTIIPFLTVHKHSAESALVPGVITPSLCLILQGSKKLHLGHNILSYHAGDYLTSVIDIPASGQVLNATTECPYISLRIDFTIQEITSVMIDAQIRVDSDRNQTHTAAFIGKSDTSLLDALIRLLRLTDNPEKALFLSTLIKREIIFTLLTGPYGHLFLQRALFDTHNDGITKAIVWIRDNLAKSFSVESLAQFCNMSVSGFHHKFKKVTTMGPLQYQKHLRLQEARRLLLSGTMDAKTAAMTVGYQTSTQFNREYHRLFGLPPMQDVSRVQQTISSTQPRTSF